MELICAEMAKFDCKVLVGSHMKQLYASGRAAHEAHCVPDHWEEQKHIDHFLAN